MSFILFAPFPAQLRDSVSPVLIVLSVHNNISNLSILKGNKIMLFNSVYNFLEYSYLFCFFSLIFTCLQINSFFFLIQFKNCLHCNLVKILQYLKEYSSFFCEYTTCSLLKVTLDSEQHDSVLAWHALFETFTLLFTVLYRHVFYHTSFVHI